MASSSNDPDSLVTLRFHDFRVERMRHWWTLLGEDDHADIVGIFGKFPPFMRLQVDRGLLEALASFWDPTHCCFSIGEVDLIPTMEEYAGLLQLDSPFSETPVIPIQGPRSNRVLEKYLGLTSLQAKLARDFIAGQEGVEEIPNQCLQDRLRRRQGEGVPMFCTQLLQLWFCSHLQHFHPPPDSLSFREAYGEPDRPDSTSLHRRTVVTWALYLLDLPLSEVVLEGYLGAGSVDALDSLCPLRWSASSWGVGLYRLLSQPCSSICGGSSPGLRISGEVVFRRWSSSRMGSPGDSSVTSGFCRVERGVDSLLLLLRPTVRPGASIFFDISLSFGYQPPLVSPERVTVLERELEEGSRQSCYHLRLARASEREASAARVESHAEYLASQQCGGGEPSPRLGGSERGMEQLETEQVERTRVQDELDSLRSYTQALVDPATGRPQDIVALRRALDESEAGAYICAYFHGGHEGSDQRSSRVTMESCRLRLDLVHDALESNASWLNQEGFPVVTSLHPD
uniref:DUF7745 domain-containing protein n=1 Tax=Fagus sylvatica TaxID=28930 RepID=A0A2N9ISP0_FAGSY